VNRNSRNCLFTFTAFLWRDWGYQEGPQSGSLSNAAPREREERAVPIEATRSVPLLCLDPDTLVGIAPTSWHGKGKNVTRFGPQKWIWALRRKIKRITKLNIIWNWNVKNKYLIVK
jgi:hypothetical protein